MQGTTTSCTRRRQQSPAKQTPPPAQVGTLFAVASLQCIMPPAHPTSWSGSALHPTACSIWSSVARGRARLHYDSVVHSVLL